MMISTRSILQTVTEISRALWWMFPSAKSGVKKKEGGKFGKGGSTKSVSKDTHALKSAASKRSFPFFSTEVLCKIPLEPPGILCASSLTLTDQGRTGTSKSLFDFSALTQVKHRLDLQFPVWLWMKNQLRPVALCLNLSDQPRHTKITAPILNHSY